MSERNLPVVTARMPIIGYKGGGKGGGSGGGASQRTPIEAPDSARSRSFARGLDLIQEGEIEGFVNGMQSVFLDETPIQNPNGSFNHEGVTIYMVHGTQDQQFMPGFPGIESEFSVATEVTFGNPVVRTITNANIDLARVRISIPQLSTLNSSTGDLTGATVQLAIDVQPSGEEYYSANLSSAWQPADRFGDTVIMRVDGTGIAGTVSWERAAASYSVFSQPPRQSITIDVEYRVIGHTEWILFKRETLTDDDFRGRGVQAGAYNGISGGVPIFTPAALGYQPASIPLYQQSSIPARIYEITGLPRAHYEMRIAKVSGDGNQRVGNPRLFAGIGSDTITDKISSKYERSYLFQLNGSAPWNIRVRRITADSTVATLQNKLFFESYTEVIERKLRYPNSAIVGWQVEASQFKSVPSRIYHMKLMRVRCPSNYNPTARTYSGVWDGTFQIAYTNNPAWCFYDLCTNTRYGAGKFLGSTPPDKGALYTIGKYCDELVHDGFGGQEPRMTCFLYLQEADEAYNVLNAFASIFRGMLYMAEGKVVPVQDSPEGPLFQFSESDVIDGMFNYSGSSLEARHTAALVSWNDMENFGRQKVEYVEDPVGIARYGYNPIEVPAIGCSSRGMAHRVGKAILIEETYNPETITFRTGLKGAAVRPGRTMRINDAHRAGVRFGGRVVSATDGSSSEVTIDSPVTIMTGLTYTLTCTIPVKTQWAPSVVTSVGDKVYSRAPNLLMHFECVINGTTGLVEPVFSQQLFGETTLDGTVTWRTCSNLEEAPITNEPGTHSVLNMARPFAFAPEPMSDWMLISSALEPSLWRVLSIAEVEPHIYEISGLTHNPSKYGAIENDLSLEMHTTTVLTGTPSPISGLEIGEYLITKAGKNITVMTLKWEALAGASSYMAEYRKDKSAWIKTPEVRQAYTEVVDVIPGSYEVRVVSVNSIGGTSLPVSKSRILLGKANPPQDVLNFVVARSLGALFFSWPHILDSDLDYYALRRGSTWESAIPIGETRSNNFRLDTSAGGTYLLKAFDKLKLQSANAAVITASDYTNINVVVEVDDATGGWTGTKVNVAVDTGAIVLTGSLPWSALTNAWSTYTDSWALVSAPFMAGTYTTNVIDLGGIFNSRVEVLPTVVQSVIGGSAWTTYTEPWSFYTEPWTGTPGKVSATFEIRTSNDNTNWSSWAPFVVGFYSARYLQVRASLATIDINYLPRLTALPVRVDVPDRAIHFEDQSVASGGLTVNFTPDFVNLQTVQGTIQGGAIGDTFRVTAKSNASITVQVFDSAGVAKAATMDIDVFGYGERL